MDREPIQAGRELANSGLKTVRMRFGQIDVDPERGLIGSRNIRFGSRVIYQSRAEL